MPLPHRATRSGDPGSRSVRTNKQASKQARRYMPRKQIIKRKVRRLTPREINFLVKGVVAFEMEVL
jgi:hypothetical protein